MRAALLGAAALGALAVSCGAPDPAEAIRARIAEGAAAAEAGDLRALRGLLSADYADDRGRDRDGALALLAAYVGPGRRVHVWHRTQAVEVDGPRARATVDAALGARPLDRDRLLEGAEAEVGRLQLELALEDGRWNVTAARWEGVDVDALFR